MVEKASSLKMASRGRRAFWFVLFGLCLQLLAADLALAQGQQCGICKDCGSWFSVPLSCCGGNSPSCQGLPCCGPVNDNYKYSVNNCLAFPACKAAQPLCCSNKQGSCCNNVNGQEDPCCGVTSTHYLWQANASAVSMHNSVVTFTIPAFDMIREFPPSGQLSQVILELPDGWEITSQVQCGVEVQDGTGFKRETKGSCIRSSSVSRGNPNTPASILFYNLESFTGGDLTVVDPSYFLTLIIRGLNTPSLPMPAQTKRFWMLNESFSVKADYNVQRVGQGAIRTGFFSPKNVHASIPTEGLLEFISESALEPDTTLLLDFQETRTFINPNASWTLDKNQGQIPVACATNGNVTTLCNLTIPTAIPPDTSVRLGVSSLVNPSIGNKGSAIGIEARRGNITTMSLSALPSSVILENVLLTKSPSPFSIVSIVIYGVCFLICAGLTWTKALQFSKVSTSQTPIWAHLTALCALLNFLVLIIGNALWLTEPTITYQYLSVISLCLVWTMLVSVCFNWGTAIVPGLLAAPFWKLVLLYLAWVMGFYAFVVWGALASSDIQQDFLESRLFCKSGVCGVGSTGISGDPAEYTNTIYADVQPSDWRGFPESSLLSMINVVTYAAFCLIIGLILALGMHVMRTGNSFVEGGAQNNHQESGLEYFHLRKALKMFQMAIGLAIAVYLIAFLMQLCLFSTAIKYQWWYVFAVWLPNAVPPCCFLALQWSNSMDWLKTLQQNQGAERNVFSPVSSHASALNPTTRYDALDTPSLHDPSLWDVQEDTWSTTGETKAGAVGTGDRGLVKSGGENGLGKSTIQSVQFFIPLTLELSSPLTPGRGVMVKCEISNLSSADGRSSSSRELGVATYQDYADAEWENNGSTETVFSYDAESGKYIVRFRYLVEVIRGMVSDFVVRFSVIETSEVSEEVDYSSPNSTGMNELMRGGRDTDPSDVDEDEVDAESEEEHEHFLGCFFTTSASLSTAAKAHQPIRMTAQKDSSDKQDVTAVLVAQPIVIARRVKPGANHMISKQFAYVADRGGQRKTFIVEENLTESVFVNDIPRQILEIILRQRVQDYMMARHDQKVFEEYFKQRLNKEFFGGFYETLIDHIQDHGDLSSVRAWLEDRVRERREYVRVVKQGCKLALERDKKDVLFKSSALKKDDAVRFHPINLHYQQMWVGPEEYYRGPEKIMNAETGIYDTVTVGAMAAHVYKFKNGGLQRMVEQAEKHYSPDGPAAYPDWSEEEQKQDDRLWEIKVRRDVCVTQAVSALVQSFAAKLDIALRHHDQEVGEALLRQWTKLGFLLQVESLLSTHGKEVGMIEDMADAISELNHVAFLLQEEGSVSPEDTVSSLTFRNSGALDEDLGPGVISVEVFESFEAFQKQAKWRGDVPLYLTTRRPSLSALATQGYFIRFKVRTGAVKLPRTRGCFVRVMALLFTQGINEMQTIANSTNSSFTEIQDKINGKSIKVLTEYASGLFNFFSKDPHPVIDRTFDLHQCLENLQLVFDQTKFKKTKAVEILQHASDFCREVNAGRVTVCKSAKDRTSMSVTLEQGRILVRKHSHPAKLLAQTVATMRAKGVRIENAYKNTGRRYFAFNAFQRQMLPEEYRCPPGTGGQNKS